MKILNVLNPLNILLGLNGGGLVAGLGAIGKVAGSVGSIVGAVGGGAGGGAGGGGGSASSQNLAWYDPNFLEIKKKLGEWLAGGIGEEGKEYLGQLVAEYPELLTLAANQVQGQLQTPWKAQYYSPEPLQALKTAGMGEYRESAKEQVLDPLAEKLAAWGIVSSYGAESPYLKAQEGIEKDVANLGKQYDVDIQNMLQQGQNLEYAAYLDALNQAGSFGTSQLGYEQYKTGTEYQDWLRKVNFPYETQAPLALNYLGALSGAGQVSNSSQSYPQASSGLGGMGTSSGLSSYNSPFSNVASNAYSQYSSLPTYSSAYTAPSATYAPSNYSNAFASGLTSGAMSSWW